MRTWTNVIEDHSAKTVIIRIDYAYLRAIEIDPGQIIIEDEQESLLARENIKPKVVDYTAFEQDIPAGGEIRYCGKRVGRRCPCRQNSKSGLRVHCQGR